MAKSYADYSNYAKIRDGKDMTDYAVAQAAGISTVTMTSWKQGIYTPKADKLLRIAQALNVRIEDLLTVEEEG